MLIECLKRQNHKVIFAKNLKTPGPVWGDWIRAYGPGGQSGKCSGIRVLDLPWTRRQSLCRNHSHPVLKFTDPRKLTHGETRDGHTAGNLSRTKGGTYLNTFFLDTLKCRQRV